MDAAQRIAGVGRVKQDQGQVGVGHVQRVDQPVVGLAGQVPQHGFAARAVGALGLQLIEHPELLAVGRGMFFELALRQPPAQPRLAHARIADQHDLGCGMEDGLVGRALSLPAQRFPGGLEACATAEQHGVVQLPDVDELVGVAHFRPRVGAGRGQQRLVRMKRQTGRPIA